MLDSAGKVEVEFGGSRGRLVADGQRFVLDVDDPSVLIGVVELRSLRTMAAGPAGGRLHTSPTGRRWRHSRLTPLCSRPRAERSTSTG